MIALNTKETYCSQDWLEIHSNRNEMLLDDAQNCLEGSKAYRILTITLELKMNEWFSVRFYLSDFKEFYFVD